MNVNVESPKPYLKTIAITVPTADVEEKIENQLADYRKKLALPGYRPGKAPMALVRRMIGTTVESEVTETIIKESLAEVLKEHDFDPVAPPTITDFKYTKGEDLTFSTEIEIVPRPEKVEYEALSLQKIVLPVTEKEVDEELEGLRKRQAILTPVERPSQDEDTLVINAVEMVEGVPQEETREAGQSLTLGENLFPELREALTGKTEGHTCDVTVNYPDKPAYKNNAGKTVTYHIEIISIKESVLPELDDEFAKNTLKVDTVAEMREQLMIRLQRRAVNQEKEQMRAQIRSAMIERNPFEIGPKLLEKTLEDSLHGYGLKSAEQLPEDLRQSFMTQIVTDLHWSLIKQLMEEHINNEVAAEENKAWITTYAEREGLTYTKALGALQKEGLLDSIADIIRMDRIYDLILSTAVWTE